MAQAHRIESPGAQLRGRIPRQFAIGVRARDAKAVNTPEKKGRPAWIEQPPAAGVVLRRAKKTLASPRSARTRLSRRKFWNLKRGPHDARYLSFAPLFLPSLPPRRPTERMVPASSPTAKMPK
jgi:hypothetical protein